MIVAEFIGGPWDGEMHELEEAPNQLRVQLPGLVWVGSDPPAPLSASGLVYRLVAPRIGVTSPVRYVLERVAR